MKQNIGIGILLMSNGVRNLPSLMLRICGLITLAFVISMLCQIFIRWSDDRVRSWSPEITIDLSDENTYTIPLIPIVTRMHSCRFSLFGPPLRQYKGKHEYLGSDLIEKVLPGKSFKLSWRIDHSGNIIAKGTVNSSDFSGYTYDDRTEYTDIWEIFKLKCGREYSFTMKVEESNPLLKDFHSILRIYTWVPKGPRLYGWRITLLLLIIFLIGLLVSKYIARSKDFASSDRREIF